MLGAPADAEDVGKEETDLERVPNRGGAGAWWITLSPKKQVDKSLWEGHGGLTREQTGSSIPSRVCVFHHPQTSSTLGFTPS